MEHRFIRYGLCNCYVWLLAMTAPVGRCGRCGVKPDHPYYGTHKEALDKYVEEHGREPRVL